MRSFSLLTLSVALLGMNVAQADDTKDFLDAENWKGIDKNWTVEGTSVTGHTDVDLGFNTFLVSQKKYSDFEMSFKVELVEGKGNSGIQVRSTVVDPEKFVVGGPQCDMGQQYWGSLYGEKVGGMMQACAGDFVEKHVQPVKVNDYYLSVKGDQFTIKVNGEASVDKAFPMTPDKKKLLKEGVIAFQLHQGGPMTVKFTDIKFTDLSKK